MAFKGTFDGTMDDAERQKLKADMARFIWQETRDWTHRTQLHHVPDFDKEWNDLRGVEREVFLLAAESALKVLVAKGLLPVGVVY